MSSTREQFFATIRHERPDRVPLDLWARPEVLRKLQTHLGTNNVQDALGISFASVVIADRIPAFDCRSEEPKGGDWLGSNTRYIWHDDCTFEDGWGVVHRLGEDGKLVEWIDGPLVGVNDPDEYSFPNPSCLTDPAEVAPKVAQLKSADKVVLAEVTMPFKRAWQMRGMENLLCDMLLDPDFVERVYEKIYPFETERAVRCAQAGVDCVMVIGDIAMEDRLLFKPELFRRLDVPRLRELIRRVRQIKPDVVMFYHSDGDLSAAMDHLIEVGFDAINPIQPECMDPDEVKRRWGKNITLWGTIGVRSTLRQSTPDAIRVLVRERIRRCGYDGGLVLAPAGVVMYDTAIENVVALYEAAREFTWDDAEADR